MPKFMENAIDEHLRVQNTGVRIGVVHPAHGRVADIPEHKCDNQRMA